MTEPHHEPSYYEIALTNRQVVVAFVILLVCLLAAFFSGVWIGRGGIDSRKDQIVRATPPTSAAPPEGRTLEELKFFADRQSKKGGKTEKTEKTEKPEEKPVEVAQIPAPEEKPAAAAPSTPAPEPSRTTLQQDIGQPRPNPAAKVPNPAAKGRSPVIRSTPPAPAPEETAAEPPAPRPAASERGERSARTADATTGGAGTGSIVIQVFASADQAEANRVRDRLTKGGQSAFLSPLTVDGRTMYRVRIGPFASRPKAQQIAEKVRKTYKLDTWLTQ